jgi:fido (protein-threonine AMPylation protein)
LGLGREPFAATNSISASTPGRSQLKLRNCLDDIRYRWEHADDWNPRQLGIAVHAAVVRIHPFTDGNGRSTRLLADLVFVAAQLESVADNAEILVYDGQVEKGEYIRLLHRYDGHRDPAELAAFLPVKQL